MASSSRRRQNISHGSEAVNSDLKWDLRSSSDGESNPAGATIVPRDCDPSALRISFDELDAEKLRAEAGTIHQSPA